MQLSGQSLNSISFQPGKSNVNPQGSKPQDGRHKKRVRQPHSTTERQRQKAIGRGEYLMNQQGKNQFHLTE